jgi:CubicO group peptidase (beta-lactamase class C family)
MVDREAGVAMQPNTIFNIRSMTKMLTGAAIQMLMRPR